MSMGRVTVTPFKVNGKGNVEGRLYEGVLIPNMKEIKWKIKG